MARFLQKLAEEMSADAHYQQDKQAAMELLGKIQEQIHQHGQRQGRESENWGYYGDMKHVVELLGQISDFLNDPSGGLSV